VGYFIFILAQDLKQQQVLVFIHNLPVILLTNKINVFMAGKQLTFDMSLTDRTLGDTLREPLKDEGKLQSCDRPL